MNTDFSSLSLNTLYEVCDKILANKEFVEDHLRNKERDLFGLDEITTLLFLEKRSNRLNQMTLF